jgi:hypothetical protein
MAGEMKCNEVQICPLGYLWATAGSSSLWDLTAGIARSEIGGTMIVLIFSNYSTNKGSWGVSD